MKKKKNTVHYRFSYNLVTFCLVSPSKRAFSARRRKPVTSPVISTPVVEYNTLDLSQDIAGSPVDSEQVDIDDHGIQYFSLHMKLIFR